MIYQDKIGPHPMPGQVLIKVSNFSDSEQHYDPATEQREPVVNIHDANAVTSRTTSSLLSSTPMHKPVLDIDFPAKLVPSSTPGHSHLYLDRELSWPQYKKLLDVLAEVGIIQDGYADSAIKRGYSAVRLPWVKKEQLPFPRPDFEPKEVHLEASSARHPADLTIPAVAPFPPVTVSRPTLDEQIASITNPQPSKADPPIITKRGRDLF